MRTPSNISKQRQVLSDRLKLWVLKIRAIRANGTEEQRRREIPFCEAEIAKLRKELASLRYVNRSKKQVRAGWGWTGR